jgi:hypothetical protein
MSQIYTPDQWEQLEPVLRRLAHGSVLMAREVLVEGLRSAEVARRHDTTRQHVGQIVRRVRKTLRDEGRIGFSPVVLWVPGDLAARVEMLDPELVEQAICKLITEAQGKAQDDVDDSVSES